MRGFLQGARARLRTQGAALLVLAVGIAATLAVYLYVSRAIAGQAQARFDSLAVGTVDAIHDRFDAYVATLRATRGLFLKRELPSRQEFAEFVRSLELDDYYPGIQGIGYAQLLRPGDLERHEAAVRAEGFPGYRVWPPGPRDPYTAIVYLEPFDWRNQRAFGYDMLSEPIRREAMLRALDSGEASATRRVELVQEAGEKRQPGFLIYLAVCAPGPQDVPRERRARGFVYAPFRAGDLLAATFGADPDAPVAVEVFDGDRADPAELLYGSPALRLGSAAPEKTAHVDVAGRRWTVRIMAAATFGRPWERWLPRGVLLIGLLVTVALFRVTREEGRSRAVAERAARRASFLADAGKVLAASLDYRATLAEVARRAARDLADWCVVLVVEREGLVRLVGHLDDARARDAESSLEGLLLDPEARFGAAAALEHGEVFVVRHVDDAALRRIARSPEQLRALRAEGLRSVMTVPLRTRGERLGAITFAACDPLRAYDDADVTMLEDLGRLAAAAIDTARLYRSAQDAVRLRDDFLSIASHELKTPLTALKLQLQLGQRREGPGAAPWIGAAVRQADRVGTLVAELLDLARIRAGRLTLDARPVDLAELACAVAGRLSDVLERSGNALRVDAPAPVGAACDPARVDQVLTNLLTNASRHAPGADVSLRVSREGDRAVLVVEDDGPGIPAEALERVFEAYEKADPAGREQGLGLGLYIVRRIVEAHGGTIRAGAGRAGGASFRVELPAAPLEPSVGAAGRAGAAEDAP